MEPIEIVEVFAENVQRLSVHMDRLAHPLPGQAVTLPVAAGNRMLVGMEGILLGWSIINLDGAAAAAVNLYDGSDTGGQLVAAIGMAVAGGSTISLSPAGIKLDRGLFATVSTTVNGVVYVLPARRHD